MIAELIKVSEGVRVFSSSVDRVYPLTERIEQYFEGAKRLIVKGEYHDDVFDVYKVLDRIYEEAK